MLRRAMMAGVYVPPVTFNPADKASEITLSSGNLVASRTSTNNNQWRLVRVTEARSTGKRYAEIINTTSVSNGLMVGVCPAGLSVNSYPGSSSTSFGYHANDAAPGYCYTNAAQSFGDGARVGSGSYARIAIDFDAGNLWLGNAAGWKNGGSPGAGTSPTYTFTPNASLFLAVGEYANTQAATLRLSGFGGTVPSAFVAY
jgi:hypothetical protein